MSEAPHPVLWEGFRVHSRVDDVQHLRFGELLFRHHDSECSLQEHLSQEEDTDHGLRLPRDPLHVLLRKSSDQSAPQEYHAAFDSLPLFDV